MESILFDNKYSCLSETQERKSDACDSLVPVTVCLRGPTRSRSTAALKTRAKKFCAGVHCAQVSLINVVGLAAGQWASDHGRANGGGRAVLALCK